MTYSELLNEIKIEFASQIHDYTQKEELGLQRMNTFELIKMIYLSAYVDILDRYVNTTITGDENFFTESEIWDIIQHINGITEKDFAIN